MQRTLSIGGIRLYDVCTGLVRTTLRRPYGSRGLARDRELPSVDCVVAAIHSRCGDRKQVDDEWLLSETVRELKTVKEGKLFSLLQY